jgi:hypothetical protein
MQGCNPFSLDKLTKTELENLEGLEVGGIALLKGEPHILERRNGELLLRPHWDQ